MPAWSRPPWTGVGPSSGGGSVARVFRVPCWPYRGAFLIVFCTCFMISRVCVDGLVWNPSELLFLSAFLR